MLVLRDINPKLGYSACRVIELMRQSGEQQKLLYDTPGRKADILTPLAMRVYSLAYEICLRLYRTRNFMAQWFKK